MKEQKIKIDMRKSKLPLDKKLDAIHNFVKKDLFLKTTKKIGDYEPQIQMKGYNEASINGIKDNEVFWSVYMGEGSGFDTLRQEDAIHISLLMKINQKLDKLLMVKK